MVYLPDVPHSAEIERFYHGYADFKGAGPRRLSRWQVAASARRDRFICILQESGGLLGQSLVEIGCSFGRFLQLARYCGAEVRGVELDEAALRYLRSVGIKADVRIPGHVRADVICAFQLLEHLEDPDALLTQVSQTLSEDGRLLLAVPNGGEFAKLGKQWIGFRVDLEHLNYFSVTSMARLLYRHGLIVEQYWLHNQPHIRRVTEWPQASRSLAARIVCGVRNFVLTPRSCKFSAADGTFVLTVLARRFVRRSRAIGAD